MANDEHVAKLKEGVAAWQGWRRENWTVKPDLVEDQFCKINCSNPRSKFADIPSERKKTMRLCVFFLGLFLVGCEGSSETKKVASVAPSAMHQDTIRTIEYDTLRVAVVQSVMHQDTIRTIEYDTLRVVRLDTVRTIVYDTIRTVVHDTLKRVVQDTVRAEVHPVSKAAMPSLKPTHGEMEEYVALLSDREISRPILDYIIQDVPVFTKVTISTLEPEQVFGEIVPMLVEIR